MKMQVITLMTSFMLIISGCSSSGSSDPEVEDDMSSEMPGQTISSRFDVDDESWTITGDAQGSSGEPIYEASTENSSAHIAAIDDASGRSWFFSAPEKFTGNFLEFYGGTLSFDLKTSTTENYYEDEDIKLRAGDLEISTQLPRLPEAEFTSFTILLTETNWVDTADQPIDVNTFTTVLMNLDSLEIRGEYNNGADFGGLDNVVMSVGGQ